MKYTENYRAITSLNVEGAIFENLFREYKEVFPKRWFILDCCDNTTHFLIDNFGRYCHYDVDYYSNVAFWETKLDNKNLEFPLTDKMIDNVISSNRYAYPMPSERAKAEAYELYIATLNGENPFEDKGLSIDKLKVKINNLEQENNLLKEKITKLEGLETKINKIIDTFKTL